MMLAAYKNAQWPSRPAHLRSNEVGKKISELQSVSAETRARAATWFYQLAAEADNCAEAIIATNADLNKMPTKPPGACL